MNKVQAKRLLKLADHLSTNVARKQFNYEVWLDSHPGVAVKPNLSCGTAACAYGHAASMPTFRRLGLTIGKNEYGNMDVLFNGKMRDPTDGIAAIFGEGQDVKNLFLPSLCESNATPKQVAKKIRKHVKSVYPELLG